VLAAVESWLTHQDNAHPLEVETIAAQILQRRVRHHTWLCCREARRSGNLARTRYAWRLPDGLIHVWMPAAVAGHGRRLWLEAHITDPDPSHPGESSRVQSIVDQHFGVTRVLSMANENGFPSIGSEFKGADLVDHLGDDRGAFDFAETVAQEKADRIEDMRPSIRKLGPDRLKHLVLYIFHALSTGSYNQQETASLFDLAEPSLSRFAGRDWSASEHVPDLWVNCAQTLATHDEFVEAAINAGLWDAVARILECSRNRARKDQP